MKQFIATFALLTFLFACQKQSISIDPTTFNGAVNTLSEFDQPNELSEPELLEESDPEPDPDNDAYECFTRKFKAAPGFDELLALDPTSDVIFPGAMLEGNSIPTGEYIPITTDRAPITLSVSLQNLSGSPVVEIDDPKLSTVREGIKSILDQEVVSSTPAKINFSIEQVYSEEHLRLALGANYRAAGNSISTSFNFNSSSYKNRFVLKYLQVYYSIDMDPPEDPSDLFRSIPEVEDLGATSPVYVASMSYGRMVLYTIESNRSETEINAAFNAVLNSGGGSVDASYEEIIEESNVKALVIGGSGADAAQTINGPSEVYSFIAAGGEYSKDSPGAPLAYKLRFIKKGTPVARVVLTSEYQIRTCEFTSPTYRLEVDYVKCNDCPEVGDPDIYGNLTAQAYKSGAKQNPAAVWSRSRSNPLEVKKNQKYSLGITKQVTLYRPNYGTDYIRVSGWIKERDGASDDDDFGSDSENVALSRIPVGGTQTILLDFDGSVEANFILTRLE